MLQSDMPVSSISMQIISAYYGAVALWCMSDGKIDQTEIIKDFCKDSLTKIINSYRR